MSIDLEFYKPMFDILLKKEGCLTLRQIQWAIEHASCSSNCLLNPHKFYKDCLEVFDKSEFDLFVRKTSNAESIVLHYNGHEIITNKAQLNFFERFISSGVLYDIAKNAAEIRLDMESKTR